jgi:hypothetical protein
MLRFSGAALLNLVIAEGKMKVATHVMECTRNAQLGRLGNIVGDGGAE